MGKLIWHTMMSLDGFIAGPNDDMSWAFGVESGAGETVKMVLSSTGALLVGRRTQDVEDRLLEPISSVDEGSMTVLHYSARRASPS